MCKSQTGYSYYLYNKSDNENNGHLYNWESKIGYYNDGRSDASRLQKHTLTSLKLISANYLNFLIIFENC
jgi:hypothetical protein